MNTSDIYFQNALIPPPEEKSEVVKYTRIAIDSKDRNKSLYPNANKYEIKLSDDINDVISAKLINADIPLSMYLINMYFDTLTVQQGEVTYNIQLEHGDYTATELATLLTETLNNQFGANSFGVSYNTNKDNFTFVSTDTFSLIFGESDNSLDVVLGFGKRQYVSSQIGSAPLTHVIKGEYRKNFEHNNCAIMYIEQFDNYKSPSNEIDRCFAILPSVYTLLNVSDSADLIKVFSPPIPRMAKLVVSFLDRYGNPYDFSNLEHRFEILVKSHKQARRYNQIFSN
jgi:hypothetical protein